MLYAMLFQHLDRCEGHYPETLALNPNIALNDAIFRHLRRKFPQTLPLNKVFTPTAR